MHLVYYTYFFYHLCSEEKVNEAINQFKSELRKLQRQFPSEGMKVQNDKHKCTKK